MSAPDLATLLKGASALPTLPQVVTHILETLNDDNADADSLVQRLNTDPVIVARLLAAANSSAFGLSSQVASTRQAILVLGLKTVRTITLATALIEQFGNVTSGFDGRLLWRHSVGVATCARVIAERIGHNAEVKFMSFFIFKKMTVTHVTAEEVVFQHKIFISTLEKNCIGFNISSF